MTFQSGKVSDPQLLSNHMFEIQIGDLNDSYNFSTTFKWHLTPLSMIHPLCPA